MAHLAPGAIFAISAPGLVDEAGADENRIGPRAERHVDPSLFPRLCLSRAEHRRQTAERHVDHGIMRPVARFDGDVGERVGRRAFLKEPPQRLFRIVGLKQRPVGLLANAGKKHLDVRLQPDRYAARRDILAGGPVHEGAAAGRENLRPGVQQPRDHPALSVAEISLAEPLENLRDRELRSGLDLGVGVNEGEAELRRQPFSDRRLAGAHHPDEHDRSSVQCGGDALDVDRLSRSHALFTPVHPRYERGPLQHTGGECDRPPPVPTVLRAAPVLATMTIERRECDGIATRS